MDAAQRLGADNVAGVTLLTEAAIAWRGGDRATARVLASAASTRAGTASRAWGVLPRTLACACGDQEGQDLEALTREALACPLPGILVQSLGLLARSGGPGSDERDGAVERAAQRIPRHQWGLRREVLSVEEALRLTIGRIPEP